MADYFSSGATASVSGLQGVDRGTRSLARRAMARVGSKHGRDWWVLEPGCGSSLTVEDSLAPLFCDGMFGIKASTRRPNEAAEAGEARRPAGENGPKATSVGGTERETMGQLVRNGPKRIFLGG